MLRSPCQVLCDVRLKAEEGSGWEVVKEVDKWSCPVQAHVGRGGGDGWCSVRICWDALHYKFCITFIRKGPQKLQLIPVAGHVSALPEQSAHFYLKESISFSFLRLVPERGQLCNPSLTALWTLGIYFMYYVHFWLHLIFLILCLTLACLHLFLKYLILLFHYTLLVNLSHFLNTFRK